MLVYNGAFSNGQIQLSDSMVYMLNAIDMGNSTLKQRENEANMIIDNFVTEVPAAVGQKVPVETFNVRFGEGGFSSDSSEFNKNTSSFGFKKEDFKLTVYSHSAKELLDSRNIVGGGELKLLEEDTKKTERIMNTYINTFLPSMKVITLITGDSNSLSIPTVNNGGAYTDNIGALRGEDMSDLLLSIVTDKAQRNHYLGKAGATLSTSDIQGAARKLKEYSTYSQQGVLALVNNKTADDLVNVYGFAGTKDELVALDIPVTVIAGVNFYILDMIPDGKILFVDAGERELIINAVNVDPLQRGVGMYTNSNNLSTIDDLNGAELIVWAFGMHVFKREKLLWLDITTAGASDTLGNYLMDASGVTALQAWAASLRQGITGKNYIA